MMRSLVVILLLALPTGCAHLPGPREYYPNLALSNWQTRHDFTADWYGKHLRAMREPSLQAKVRANALILESHRVDQDRPSLRSTYRFLYLPTFSEPVMFRLEIDEAGKAVLITKRTNGKGGYGAGTLTFNATTPVAPSQLDQFRQLIKKMDLDAMPTTVPEMGGLDGSEWILEVADGEVNHLITRWCARDPVGGAQVEFDDNGNIDKETPTEDVIRKYMPQFDLDGYLEGTKRLTRIVDFLIELSPLKEEENFSIY